MRASVPLASALVALTVAAATANAQAETVFRGVPAKKVTNEGERSIVESIPPNSTGNLQVVVSRIADRYYWASRENTELFRVDAGAFITYIAVNGSGYVKAVKPDLKEAAALMSDAEARYDYAEHLTIGLRSITYYGSTRELKP
jgi:hypothetical protein